jgi:hypothetical protein
VSKRTLRRGLGALVLLGLGALTLACGEPSRHWEAGGVYSVSNGDGSFGAVKILALDPEAVGVRIYRESFPTRPSGLGSGDLSLGKIGDENLGVGHVPLAHRDFALWFPVLMTREGVSEEELEGVRIWREAGGGVFDSAAMEAAMASQGAEGGK